MKLCRRMARSVISQLPRKFASLDSTVGNFCFQTSLVSVAGSPMNSIGPSPTPSPVYEKVLKRAHPSSQRSFQLPLLQYQRSVIGFSSNWALFGLIPGLALSASFSVEAKESPPNPITEPVTLYQYEACPFCNKVKAYLDYRNIPYNVVEVDPLWKKEIKFSEYKKVPVIIIGEEQLNDSSEIITKLESQLNPEKAYLLDAERDETEEDRWRKWVDGHLVHLLSPNIYRTTSEAIEAFDYITTNGNFSFTQRMAAKYVGATAMYFIGKKLKKKYNIEDERTALYDAALEWTVALKGRHFLGGEKPNLADLAVFGVLRPIINLKTGKDLLVNTDIGAWYGRMVAEVGASTRIEKLEAQGVN